MSNEAAERLRGLIAERFDPLSDETNPLLDTALAHERSAGAAPVDVPWEALWEVVARTCKEVNDGAIYYECDSCGRDITKRDATHEDGCYAQTMREWLDRVMPAGGVRTTHLDAAPSPADEETA